MLRAFDLVKRLRPGGSRLSWSRWKSSQSSPAIGVESPQKEFTSARKLEKYQAGQTIHGFCVDDVARINDLHLTAIRLTHLRTGAQYLHLERDDSNNVFSIGFRTTPMESTGLPHILEHITLCGSEKFPCRDPFFKMLRRSLATFMNAMTGPDYTIYPFSTQNSKDFRNLQSVYMDSVFKPILRELDFRQEGWRLEHAEVTDRGSPIVLKGVVLNEMKGVFNENYALFAERLLNSLLPSHTYGVISGGDPLVIPKLTHADLVSFHATHYHPSNARFYSYGNLPLEDHLEFVDSGYLQLADKMDASTTRVPPEKRWDAPRREHIDCRYDPMIADPKRQSSIAIGHLCNDIADVQATFDLYVLSQLLLQGPNSAFYKSLVESDVGTGFSPVTGYDSQFKDTMFVVGLQGVRAQDFKKVEEIFDDTVRKVTAEGFKRDHVEAVLHGVELQVKHETSNFGLNWLFNLTPLWNHDGDLVRAMRVNDSVKALAERSRKNPEYFQDLVAKYLADNTHRLILTMSPDSEYESKRSAAERALLEEKLKGLTATALDRIYEDGLALSEEQRKVENVDVLPTLKIEDLKADLDRYELVDLQVSGVPLQLTVQPTNGVCYYRGVINTGELPEELQDSVPLFNYVAAKMGTRNYDYRTFDQMTRLKTGGLHFSSHIAEDKSSVFDYENGISLQSYCLDRNAADMWALWSELFNNVELSDIARFETLIKTAAADLVNGIADSGHVYAMSAAAALVSPVAKHRESQSGLRFVARMRGVARTKDLGDALERVGRIAEYALDKARLRSAVNLCESNKDEILRGVGGFYGALKGDPKSGSGAVLTRGPDVEPRESAVHHVLPFGVNYASKTILTVPYTDPLYAPLRVLCQLVSSIYLLAEIREKGGAYGGGSKLSLDGIFSFYSYRDPNSTRTLDTFDRTYDFFLDHPISQRDIDEAKLGVFQKIDAPVSPGTRGMTKFLYNLSDDEIQRQRESLKAVTREQLMEVAERFLKPGQKEIMVGRSLIGPPNPDLSQRCSENWITLNQEEEEALARAIE